MSASPGLNRHYIIDGHTHAWLPEDWQTLRSTMHWLDEGLPDNSPYNWCPRFDGTLASLLDTQKAARIDRFVLLPVSSRPDRSGELTAWVAEAARKHPEIIPFGALHPQSPSLAEDLTAMIDLGIKGVKLHSLVQRVDPLSPAAMSAYARLERAGLVLLMDSMNLDGAVAVKTNLKPFLKFARQLNIECGPFQIAAIARHFPGLKIIAAHMGCLYGWQTLDPLYDLDRVYFDLSYVHRLLPADQAMTIIRTKGPDRIIFGTDAPYRRPENALAWFLELPLPDREREAILAGNLLDLLGEPTPAGPWRRLSGNARTPGWDE